MDIKHDSEGFLLGAKIESITDQLGDIHKELKAIKNALGDSSPAPTAGDVQPLADTEATVTTPALGDGSSESQPQITVIVQPPAETSAPPQSPASAPPPGGAPAPTLTPTPSPAASPTASPAASPGAAPSASQGLPPVVVIPGPRPDRSRAGPPAPPASPAAVPSGRDERGRFRRTGGDGPGEDGGGGGSISGGDSDSRSARALGGIGERLVGAVREVGQESGEADPSVKAFNEIAEPLSRGFGKIFGGGEDKKQDRWYRKFWREMTQKRRDDEVNNRATRRSLRDLLLAGRGGESGGGIMGILAMLFGPLLAMFAKFFAGFSKIFKLLGALPGVKALSNLIPGRSRGGAGDPGRGGSRNPGGGRGGPGSRNPPDASGPGERGRRGSRGPAPSPIPPGGGAGGAGRGLLKRLPLIGSLLSLGFMASDVMASEGGEGTREEKDRSTGSAVGRGVGSLGGMAAGAAAGAALGSIVPGLGTAIGGIIGGVVGGFMGDKAGDIIGDTVGGWVSDLRNSNIGGAITEKWAYTTEFMGSLWSQSTAGISDRWAAVSDTVSSMWTTVSDSANAAWGAVSAGATALWDGVSSSLTSAWATAVDKMQAGWSSAVDLASKGWEALSGLAGSAKDWLKEKTGVDLEKVYENVGARATEIVGGAKDAASSAWSKVTDVAASAKSAVASGASKVADATGVTAVAGAFRTATNAADNKVRSLRADNNWASAKDDLVGASEAAGVDPGVLAKIAKYESNFDAGATPTRRDGTKISSAHGYGQFLDGTWTDSINKHGAKYGVEGAGKLNTEQAAKYRNDPKIQAAMLAEFTKENIDQGRKYGGRDDDANVYAFHNLGGGDAKKMLSGMSAGMDVRQSLMQGVNSEKGRARVEQVIAGNKDLYGDGSRSAKDAYKVMGERMRAGDSYAEDARSHLLARNQAASAPAEMTASAAQSPASPLDQPRAATVIGPPANALAGVDTARKSAPAVVASAPSPASQGLPAGNSLSPSEVGSGQAITSSPGNPFAALENPQANPDGSQAVTASPNNPFAALGGKEIPAASSANSPFAALESGTDSVPSVPASPGNPFGALDGGAKLESGPQSSGGMVATLFAGAKVAQAPTASAPVSLASGRAPSAMTAVPSAPAVSIPTAPAVAAIAEAPEVEPTPMGSPGRRQSATPAAPANIPRDIEDRRIAHIVTGAYSGAV